MPLIKRAIEPLWVSRGTVPQGAGVQDDLEYVANSTLAHIVLQLGSLSRLAEDIFSELHRETCGIVYRTQQLMERVERIKLNVVQLNPVVEEVSLHDINLRKPFRSSVNNDQQIVNAATRPTAIAEMYSRCHPTPALYKLNPYREDGKDSVKFYTDPGYFFELWCLDIARDAENQMMKHKQRAAKRTRSANEPRAIRQPKSHLDEMTKQRHGQEFVTNSPQAHGSTANRKASTLGRKGTGSSQRNEPIGSPASARTTDGYMSQPGINSTVTNGNSYGGNLMGDGVMTAQGGRPVNASYRDQGDVGSRAETLPPGLGGLQQASATYGSPRPAMSPPAPPGGYSGRPTTYNDNASAAMTSPQHRGIDGRQTPGAELNTATGVSTVPGSRSVGRNDSLLNHSTSSPPYATSMDVMQMSTNSFDLPPPPTPSHINGGMHDGMFSNTPSPPPPHFPQTSVDYRSSASPSILPPPQFAGDYAGGGDCSSEAARVLQGLFQVDTSSVNSEEIRGGVGTAETGPMVVRDTRSDLLSAIREGHQLRRVEERRQQSVRRQGRQAPGQLDVQSIMEAAFEMRRKALEDNDEDDDCDVDGHWTDDD